VSRALDRARSTSMRALVVVSVLAKAARADSQCEDGPKTAVVEYTAWIGSSAGLVRAAGSDRWVMGLRAGTGFDFELVQTDNPFGHGELEWRWGPWFDLEQRSDKSRSLHGGLSFDLGQVRHAEFGNYTLRMGGGINDDRHGEATLMFLGGVRYVPGRRGVSFGSCRPRSAFASGGRVFGSVTTDFDGRSIWLVGFELEPSWAVPPYSMRKLAGDF
jgi:hypothetical protein